jgi:hypothetical protein
MIEPDFLSVSELAARWNATPRQILEHGAHLRLPILFSFSGLAFAQIDRWLMGHGATDEQRELENRVAFVADCSKQLKRNAAGLLDEFSRMDSDEVARLRATIIKDEARIEELETLLQARDRDRRGHEYFGYMRLPPRAIREIIDDGEIPFPYLAFHPHSRLQLKTADGRPYVDGNMMSLEPGADGRWKARLRVDDLLIPFSAIKIHENNDRPTDAPAPKHVPRSEAQDSAVLAAIAELGHDPLSLPPFKSGKPWVKAKVWETLKLRPDLFVSKKTFDTAWERLRSNGDIVG